jgi:hypothetical protein
MERNAMKILAVIAAGLVATAAITPVTVGTASAAPRWGHGGWGWKTVCTTRWHHGKKWRQCRKVRVRR